MTKNFAYDWPRANITTDIVYHHPTKGVLLIKRKNYPDAGKWATPGGHFEMGERILECARREFEEEAGFRPQGKFEMLGVFDKIGRDPRDRYITFVYGVKWQQGDGEPKAGDDAADCTFLDVDEIEKTDLALDHKEILLNIFKGCFKDSNAIQWKS
jgi:8-oxo-dGTP diphosphatase